MKKTNIIAIILVIMVLGLTGYIMYDKTLSTNTTSNNNEQTSNNNEQTSNNNEQTSNNNDEEDVYQLKTLKTYAGCSKEAYQSKAVAFQYATYILEIKESNKCILYYGGVDQASSGNIMPTFECLTDGSYIKINYKDIPLFFKMNSNDTITYQNTNIIMKKVNNPEEVNYNFCKNNY